MRGQLKKMVLVGFQNAEFTKPTGLVFEAVVNPESYTHSYKVALTKDGPPGKEADAQKFIRTEPRRMEFEFLFDSTGALRPGDGLLSLTQRLGVWEQVELFKQTIYEARSDNRPPYVLLSWGVLLFKCQLEALSVTYKLFRPDGVPIRALAKATFVEVQTDTLRSLKSALKTGDLTRVATVVAGATLPQLCQQMYGDPTRYADVARANKLGSIRAVQPGKKLVFPPLGKKR